MTTPRVPTLLLAEDNPADAALFREAIISAGLDLALERVGDGQEVLDYLRRRGRHTAATRPDVLVLDLDLPVLDGREVLVELAADDGLSTLPVVILTGSRHASDAQALYRSDRSLFAVKPRHFAELVALVRRVADFAACCRGPSDAGAAS